MIEIRPHSAINCSLSVPGSKSYTHRALIAASLCNEACTLSGVLKSQDIAITCMALKKLGVSIREIGKDVLVSGLGGSFKSYTLPIYLGNSGTSMRLLTGLVSLGQGPYTLIGTKRMHQRPMFFLINAMNKIGIKVSSLQNDGCPPIKVIASKALAKVVEVDCSVSSQYLSSLLLIAPYIESGLSIKVTGRIVSRPYIDMTIAVMNDFGVFVERDSYTSFKIYGEQFYNASNYNVEPDCSHACYFWAAAAVTGGRVTVKGLNFDSKQGDIKFLGILGKMGCSVHSDRSGITITGARLESTDIDMSDMPDAVPTLAVIASFARGTTVIRGISHLKNKESDRIKTVTNELKRMGIIVKTDGHVLAIQGGRPKATVIQTYNDHRIAMSFALAGLKTHGLKISDETCVVKSFPNFWEIFDMLYTS